ncbi:MSCRAMM family adhesin SdrC, partial [Motilimonas sp. E26]
IAPTSVPSIAPTPETQYSATAIDGYLKGAIVWLDLNRNFTLDADEPNATSGDGGKVLLDISGISGKATDYPLMVKAIKGVTIDEDTNQVINRDYIMAAPAGVQEITPLSTLVLQEMEQGTTQEQALAKVSAAIGLDVEKLLGDYTLDTADQDAHLAARSIVASGLLPENEAQAEESLQTLTPTTLLALQKMAQAIKDATKSGDHDGLIVVEFDESGEPKQAAKRTDKDKDGFADLIIDGVLQSVQTMPDASSTFIGWDQFPEDAKEWADTDGDGVGDNKDVFSSDASESVDTDGDGVGDNKDAFPADATESADTDGDGVGDNKDAFPADATESADTDGDGVGDNKDAFPADATESADTDGDGVGDNKDVFPSDASESVDTDGDKIGDNSDPDIDGDGYANDQDNEPLFALDQPLDLKTCVASLPVLTRVRVVEEQPDATRYKVSRTMIGADVAQEYNMLIVERGEGKFLPADIGMYDDADINNDIIVSRQQVITDIGGDKTSEFNYSGIASDINHYFGFEGGTWGYSGYNIGGALFSYEIELNKPIEVKYTRKNKWTNANELSETYSYLGKEIIKTAQGYQATCVVTNTMDDEITRIDTPSDSITTSLRMVMDRKNFYGAQYVSYRLEVDYAEYYDGAAEPNWGYSNEVRELVAMVKDNQAYGESLYQEAEQPLTYAQCLASLDDANYQIAVGDVIEHNVERQPVWAMTPQTAVYHAEVLESGASFGLYTDLTKTRYTLDFGSEVAIEDHYSTATQFYGLDGWGYDWATQVTAPEKVAAGTAPDWGFVRTSLGEVTPNSSVIFGVPSITYPTNTNHSDGEVVEYADSMIYLGKETVTVPMGQFETCKVQHQEFNLNKDVWSPETTKLNHMNNRGIVKSSRSTVGVMRYDNREAVSMPIY